MPVPSIIEASRLSPCGLYDRIQESQGLQDEAKPTSCIEEARRHQDSDAISAVGRLDYSHLNPLYPLCPAYTHPDFFSSQSPTPPKRRLRITQALLSHMRY